MEVKLLKKDKNSIELEIIGEDETLLEPLKQKLLEDPDVQIATFLTGHLLLENPKLYVKVKDGKPQAAFKRASKALSNEFEELKDIVDKKLSKKPGPNSKLTIKTPKTK